MRLVASSPPRKGMHKSMRVATGCVQTASSPRTVSARKARKGPTIPKIDSLHGQRTWLPPRSSNDAVFHPSANECNCKMPWPWLPSLPSALAERWTLLRLKRSPIMPNGRLGADRGASASEGGRLRCSLRRSRALVAVRRRNQDRCRRPGRSQTTNLPVSTP